MSEYQYYEFCSIKQPLSAEARKEMNALSSRANVGTHGASYVYNYSDFRGNSEKLLAKYFDVFFYISNFGSTQLMFRYSPHDVDRKMLENYAIPHVITCIEKDGSLILNICINHEEYSGGWVEGEGLLGDLLPLYEEIQNGDYKLLKSIQTWHRIIEGEISEETKLLTKHLSSAQLAFINCSGIQETVDTQ